MTLNRPAHQLVATVLGAGTMGAQIAAHLVNAGLRTHLLDVVPKGAAKDAPASARNAVAAAAVAKMLKSKPAAFMDPALASRVVVGNLEDDLEDRVAKSDLVIEAVIERLDIKKPLFARIGEAAPPHAILATNTSGLPIGDITADLPESVRRRVVGMHWFNPPRYMHLLEIVRGEHTDPAIADALGDFSDRVLGKGVVDCRDTPNFIGNRIGVAEMMLTNRATFEGDYTVEEVDLLNAKLMGRPKTGSFRLGDLVGIDVAALVIGNLAKATTSDPSSPRYDELHEHMVVPPIYEKMFEKGMKGDKTGQGFYKKTGKRDAAGRPEILTLDLHTLEYRPRIEPKFPELQKIEKVRDLEERIAAALRAEGRAGDFLRKVYLPLFNYAARRLGEIADGPAPIDDAMRWGYGWTLGPLQMWDAAGVAWGVAELEKMGVEVAPAARALVEAQGEHARWYGGDAAEPTQWLPAERGYAAVPRPAGMIILAAKKAAGAVIEKNEHATLVDLGDGVACVEFHSKMNSLNANIVGMLRDAVPMLQQKGGFVGLVVGNDAPHFSAGADAFSILALAGQGKWTELEKVVDEFQQAMMSLRHGPMPVVAAPHGMTLGGGCECSMSCAAIVAHAELYMGLVEAGIGLVPAGGGLKEIVRRGSEWAGQVDGGDAYPWIRRGFEAAGQAKVSTSAHEARGLGFLRPTDGIAFHKDRVIAEAKTRVLALAVGGWQPPDRNEPITVIGKGAGASFMLGAQLFAWSGYASTHDKLIGEKIAYVLQGGDRPARAVVTAQDLLDLERQAFVSLCGEQKTKDRIAHTLSTGKPLRN